MSSPYSDVEIVPILREDEHKTQRTGMPVMEVGFPGVSDKKRKEKSEANAEMWNLLQTP
jgi:hypothetical protein